MDFGYALVRIDSRGIGNSEGRLDVFGIERSNKIGADAEGQDLYDIIEWIGTQSWCNGKVATRGISYYGMVSYWATMQKPPHLAACVSYESASDLYLANRKGGVFNPSFQTHWFRNLVMATQRGEYRNQGVWTVLDKLRRLSDIETPMYLAGNWSDSELHLPGNLIAFNSISSKAKWLEMHHGNHLAAYHLLDHVRRQRQFLDYFLKMERSNGMDEVPRIRFAIKHGTTEFYRTEQSFPPADAKTKELFLTSGLKLVSEKLAESPQPIEYQAMKDILTLKSEAFDSTFEILGSPYIELDVITEAKDMDLYITLRAKDPSGKVVVLAGNHDEPMPSIVRAYFRMSHRVDKQTLLAQNVPILPGAEPQPIEPGKKYSVIIPFPPTTYIIDPGCSIEIDLGSADPKDTIPINLHKGGDITLNRFAGKNTIYSHGKLVLPYVERPRALNRFKNSRGSTYSICSVSPMSPANQLSREVKRPRIWHIFGCPVFGLSG
ncbi:alpha/beta-hydrolase [Tothia fuscella]|uniref:Alpha/beta-hydrolase n=1 Tax=Tothia fuscella TaxID=1048955 RepID=A0A9P4NDR5_9PEZI|nr:alpha/beta-hydrolase [Tothia fuscella]